jgi:hypothetical protein
VLTSPGALRLATDHGGEYDELVAKGNADRSILSETLLRTTDAALRFKASQPVKYDALLAKAIEGDLCGPNPYCYEEWRFKVILLREEEPEGSERREKIEEFIESTDNLAKQCREVNDIDKPYNFAYNSAADRFVESLKEVQKLPCVGEAPWSLKNILIAFSWATVVIPLIKLALTGQVWVRESALKEEVPVVGEEIRNRPRP